MSKMGTGGPGNIVHIDNLYVKDMPVKDNTNILLGDFVIFEAANGVRPIVSGDFSGDDTFLNLGTNQIFQAGENSNNLTSTPVANRKNTCECITIGSDWSVSMRVGAIPTGPVGILRVDAATPVFQVSQFLANGTTLVTAGNVLGQYKHKEFSTQANVSVQGDNGIVSTGLGIS